MLQQRCLAALILIGSSTIAVEQADTERAIVSEGVSVPMSDIGANRTVLSADLVPNSICKLLEAQPPGLCALTSSVSARRPSRTSP